MQEPNKVALWNKHEHSVRYYPQFHVTSVGLERVTREYGGKPVLNWDTFISSAHNANYEILRRKLYQHPQDIDTITVRTIQR
jgi:hypothetical protein